MKILNWIKSKFCSCEHLELQNNLDYWHRSCVRLVEENEELKNKLNNCLCSLPKELLDADLSEFELGNRIYRMQSDASGNDAMVLVPDGVYTHKDKTAVINNQVLVYYK